MEKRVIIGIDLGGTFIKGGAVNTSGEVICSLTVPTPKSREVQEVCEAIAKVVEDICKQTSLSFEEVIGVGVACPGLIDREKGVVISSSNLRWFETPFKKILQEKCHFPIALINDAVAALLGEMKFGAGKGEKNVVMLTLGTGVGTGVWKDGRLLDPIEVGHIVMDPTGEQCACGRRGCFETYASATALVRETKRAIEREETQMKQEETVTGETVFRYYLTDKTAQRVLSEYLQRLACGIVNATRIFFSETVILGGGICSSLQPFISQLQDEINKETVFPIRLLTAKNKNHAGVIGAAALWR